MAKLFADPCPIIRTVRPRAFLSPSSSLCLIGSPCIHVWRPGCGSAQGRYVIPDVAVFHPIEPSAVPETPPLVAIDVLSPDDRVSEVREKLEEYRAWGVPHVWLIDPRPRRFYMCDAGLIEQSTLQIPELGIELTDKDIFR
jgi:Uma2 family endonuclease